MNYPFPHSDNYQYYYPPVGVQEERQFPILPFLTGLAFGPFLYGAFNPVGYYGYPPYYPYPPYNYGYGYKPGYGYGPYKDGYY